jgi:hypothetical protein
MKAEFDLRRDRVGGVRPDARGEATVTPLRPPTMTRIADRAQMCQMLQEFS